MYAVCIEGHDKKGKVHYVECPYFKYIDTVSGVVNDAIEDITGAPWFCNVDSVRIKNTETSLMQMFELVIDNKEKAKIEVCSLVKGWIARDMQQLCDDESDDESDDAECGDLASKYNELASKYNELASKYNVLASLNGTVIITGSENENPSKHRKLFI